MLCRTCIAFKRELSREGEKEAAATLKRRARSIGSVADRAKEDVLENAILVSRKRQAHVASELHAHREYAHGELLDSSPEVHKIA